MKKIFYCLSLLVCFLSCENDSNPIAEQDKLDAEMILGTWDFDKKEFTIKTNSIEADSVIESEIWIGSNPVSYTFTKDSLFSVYENYCDTSRYYIENNILHIETYVIRWNGEKLYGWINHTYSLNNKTLSYIIDKTTAYYPPTIPQGTHVEKAITTLYFNR